MVNVLSRRLLIVVILAAVALVAGSAEWNGESRAARAGAAALLREGVGREWQELDDDEKRSLAKRWRKVNGRHDIAPADIVDATDAFVAEFGPDFTTHTPMRALIDFAVDAAEEREWAAIVGDHPAPVPALQAEPHRAA